MSRFFRVKTLDQVFDLIQEFDPLDTETLDLEQARARVLGQDLLAREDMPGFRRATMDGFAVAAASTFGASDSSPAWLEICGSIAMGQIPDFELAHGQAARIATGGMLPPGADAVVMVEHAESVDETSVEIYKSVAPLQHVIDPCEDFARDQRVMTLGQLLTPQALGLAAGLGYPKLTVFRQPLVGIVSTGDEVIPIDQTPVPGKIRDINSYSLGAMVEDAGARVVRYGIVRDDPAALDRVCQRALAETDMLMISGGSSVGTRDFTVDVLSGLPDTEILVHGMSVSPGKPTILAKSSGKPVWGLPGQVVSAMVVVKIVVLPFLSRLRGLTSPLPLNRVRARLSRNLASAQGRRDFIRVALETRDRELEARPLLGKSGLIRTMVRADGLLEIGEHVEGLEKGRMVDIILV